jgi:hypothetical protein
MNHSPSSSNKRTLLAGVLLMATLSMTGCQTSQGGQVLPSANKMSDDIQYFPTGSKFKLEKEAAAMKAYADQQAQTGRGFVDQQVQAGQTYAGQQVQAGQAYAGQQVQAGYAYADQKLQAGRAYADQRVQQAAGMIPTMGMLPAAPSTDSSVTVSE